MRRRKIWLVGKKLETVPEAIMEEVRARVAPIFE